MAFSSLSRRSFLAASAMLPWALRARASASIPVGLELYSVREALRRDPAGTVRAVAQLGYECVEFFAPESIERARDRNLILGCKYIVLSSSEEKSTLDAWKGLADSLNAIADKLEQSGLRV